ncbi:MAG TPA: hypothetical protein VNH82_08290 [Candidatus Dormibacteraeota bacterium]|nr:hypothetical protein [Candidatus Dormibacteraeota bacterium]
MRIAGDTVGRRGGLAVSVAAVAAALLAVHGYSNPGSLVVGGSGGISTGHGSPSANTSGGTPKASPSAAASPSATPRASGTPGPLLSSTPYASYTYQLYPGSPSPSTRQALAGFTYTTRLSGSSVEFTLYASGSTQSVRSNTYPATDRVYFIEANLGDDSGDTEYSFGDDGVVVTDASGHVVQ